MSITGEINVEDLPPRIRIEDIVAHPTPPKTAAQTSWAVRAGFILIPICGSGGMNLITMLAFRFITDNLAISAAAAGLMFALVKIYDGLLDPMVGAWSDKLRTPLGRRLPFIIGGAVLMPLSVVAIFGVPDLGSLFLSQVLMTLALAVHASAYTALGIPGMAMAVEATDDFDERTSLMAYRVFGNTLGILVGTALPAWLLAYWGATREGHLLMALVIAAVLLAAGLTACFLLKDARRTEPETRSSGHPGMIGQIKLAWQNIPFRILAISHIFVIFAVSAASASGAYFSKYVLELPDSYLGSYYSVTSLGSVLSMPAWVWLSRKMGKRFAYVLALSVYATMHLLWLTSSADEAIWLLALRAVITGMSAGGVILCAYSMLSDAVRYDYITSGQRREGVFAGFTTLFDKLASAAALSMMGVFLGAMGYISSTSANVVQPQSAILGIKICITVAPTVAIVAAIAIIMFYKLTPEMLNEPENAGSAG